MIKSLIKITSQDQIASRESGVPLNPNGASACQEEGWLWGLLPSLRWLGTEIVVWKQSPLRSNCWTQNGEI